MFSFINKYLNNNSNKKPPPSEKKEKEDYKEKEKAVKEKKDSADQNQNHHQMMISQGGGGDQDQYDQEGCCSGGPYCLGLTITAAHHHHRHHQSSSNINYCFKPRPAVTTTTTTTTTMRICRSNFAKSTTSTLFPNTQFTNHESLPCFSDALSGFTQTYPQYKETQEADRIRQHHYSHLSNHVCLDYTGFTLFSHSQLQSLLPSEPQRPLPPPFFGISYKTVSLTSQVQYGGGCETTTAGLDLESAIKNRIMSFLNISSEDYTLVCTANRTSALKLLVEAYPFHSNKSLLTVYDYESEAVSAMADCAHKRGAKVMSASFSWPSLRIHSDELKRILQYNNNKKKKKKKRGLFVFPLQSRMTGARYPYLWMRIAQENGWHVLLDACALGPKDLDTLGLSLIQPDFIICSFFKVVGENPFGFASLLVKNYSSGTPLLEGSVMGRSIGIVSIVPATNVQSQSQTESQLNEAADDLSGTFSAVSDINDTVSSFSGPMAGTLICNGSASKNINNAVLVGAGHDQSRSSKPLQLESRAQRFEQGETSSSLAGAARDDQEKMTSISSEIVELDRFSNVSVNVVESSSKASNAEIIECMGLDHADSLGLLLISSRLRYITNWLVIALLKLRHPNSENGGHSLVRIYGPRIRFERGPAIAFNVFDWKGEKVEPALVQKLADRSNISLTCGFLHNIWFSDKYQEERDAVVETKNCHQTTATKRKGQEINDVGIGVVNASLGFLANFEDAYKLWSFVARFLDADFIEKERWRYMALNQKMIEV